MRTQRWTGRGTSRWDTIVSSSSKLSNSRHSKNTGNTFQNKITLQYQINIFHGRDTHGCKHIKAVSFKVSQLRRQRGAKFDSSGLIFPWADREWSLPGSAQGLNEDGAWSHRCCWPSSAIKSSRKTIATALNHWPFYKIQEVPAMKRNTDSMEPHSFLIVVELIYIVVLVSGIQHNDSIISK